jgi:uncharacterized membrane protein
MEDSVANEGAEVYHILAFAFDGQKRADDVVKQMKHSQKEFGYKVHAYAVIEMDEKGKLHIHEPGRGGVGMGIGAGVGALLGLIGGPAGLLVWTAMGAAAGGLTGHYMGRAIKADELKKLGENMKPNSSAILALVENKAAQEVLNQMGEYDASVVTLELNDEASAALQESLQAAGQSPSGEQATPAAAA